MKGFLPQGGLYKDLLSLFRTFKTAYSGTLTTSAAFGKINPRPRGEREEFVNERSEFTNSGEGVIHSHKYAFTLAEVLITLGIIGVVAAMTMPVLMAQHRKKELETKLAKFYSTVNQAVALTNSEYGEPENWFKYCGSGDVRSCTTDDALEWFNQYIGKHLQYTKIEKDDTSFYVYFADGTIFRIANYLYDMTFFENEKAKNNPKGGRNTFSFRFNPVLLPHQQSNLRYYTYSIKPTIEPYTFAWNGTLEGLKNGTNEYGCDGVSRSSYCAKLIQINGWKIPKDYPFKF